jgi:hypothetical protein
VQVTFERTYVPPTWASFTPTPAAANYKREDTASNMLCWDMLDASSCLARFLEHRTASDFKQPLRIHKTEDLDQSRHHSRPTGLVAGTRPAPLSP